MKFINKIRIRYFRSLYDCKFEQISETLTVFTGSNDIGKSNVLRGSLNKYLTSLKDKGIVEYRGNEYYIEDQMLKTWLKHERR